jgi:hypothetical protein
MQQAIPNPSKKIKCTNSFPIQKKKRWQQRVAAGAAMLS